MRLTTLIMSKFLTLLMIFLCSWVFAGDDENFFPGNNYQVADGSIVIHVPRIEFLNGKLPNCAQLYARDDSQIKFKLVPWLLSLPEFEKGVIVRKTKWSGNTSLAIYSIRHGKDDQPSHALKIWGNRFDEIYTIDDLLEFICKTVCVHKNILETIDFSPDGFVLPKLIQWGYGTEIREMSGLINASLPTFITLQTYVKGSRLYDILSKFETCRYKDVMFDPMKSIFAKLGWSLGSWIASLTKKGDGFSFSNWKTISHSDFFETNILWDDQAQKWGLIDFDRMADTYFSRNDDNHGCIADDAIYFFESYFFYKIRILKPDFEAYSVPFFADFFKYFIVSFVKHTPNDISPIAIKYYIASKIESSCANIHHYLFYDNEKDIIYDMYEPLRRIRPIKSVMEERLTKLSDSILQMKFVGEIQSPYMTPTPQIFSHM